MKRAFSLLLALALLLTLAACGREEAPTEELPGEDWRTTGMVNDRGTIVQDGGLRLHRQRMDDILLRRGGTDLL